MCSFTSLILKSLKVSINATRTQRIGYRFKMKIRNGARSCATFAAGMCKYSFRLDLELVDEPDEVAVVVLIETLYFEIHELMLCLHIVDDDFWQCSRGLTSLE